MKLLTVKEVAEILQIRTRSVHQLTKDGILKSVKIGQRLIRFLPEDVDQMIENRTTQKKIYLITG